MKLGNTAEINTVIACTGCDFNESFEIMNITIDFNGKRQIPVMVYDFWEYLIESGFNPKQPQNISHTCTIELLMLDDLLAWVKQTQVKKLLSLSNFILYRAIRSLSSIHTN